MNVSLCNAPKSDGNMTGCLSIHVCASLAVGQIVILTFVCFTSQTVNTPKQRYPHFSAAAHCQPLFRFPSAAYQQTQHTSAVTQNNRRTFLLPTPTGQHFRECVQGREAATVRVSCSPTSAGNECGKRSNSSSAGSADLCDPVPCVHYAHVEHKRIVCHAR